MTHCLQLNGTLLQLNMSFRATLTHHQEKHEAMMMISPSFIHAHALVVLRELCLVVFGSGRGGCVGAYLDFRAVRMFKINPEEPFKHR